MNGFAVLAPGRLVLDRLSIMKRLVLVCAVLLLPLPVIARAFVTHLDTQINFAADEREGATTLRTLLPVGQQLLSAQIGALPADRPASALKNAVATTGDVPTVAGSAKARTALAAVTELLGDSGTTQAHATLDSVHALHGAWSTLIVAVADESQLTLDPDLDSYYLMNTLVVAVPGLVHHSAALAAADLALGSNEQAVEQALLQQAIDTTTSSLNTVATTTGNASVRTHARQAAKRIEAAFAPLTDPTIAADQIEPRIVAAEQVLSAELPTLTSNLDRLLLTRKNGYQSTHTITLVGVAASLLIGTYLAACYWYSIRRVVGRLAERAGELAEASATLRTVSDSVSRSATTATEQIHQVAESTEEAVSQVASASAGTHQMASAITEISRSTVDTARAANLVAGDTTETAAIVASLDESVGRIGEVTQSIALVASHTRTLALNATIEAARAGDAGAGFSVVAHEVKDLAQSTATAVQEIDRTIQEIRSVAEATRTSIASIADQMRAVSDHQNTVATAVEEHTATSQFISRSMDEVVHATEVIAHSVDAVMNAASTAAQGAEETRQAAADLSELASDLDSVVQALV